MQVWNVLQAARWKYRTQKWCKKLPSEHHRTTLSGYIFATKARIDNWKKNLLNHNVSPTCPHNMVNFGLLAADICWHVWGTPANFNGFHILAALMHDTLIVGVSQTLWCWTEGASYIWQDGHHVGHWPTFLVENKLFVLVRGTAWNVSQLLLGKGCPYWYTFLVISFWSMQLSFHNSNLGPQFWLLSYIQVSEVCGIKHTACLLTRLFLLIWGLLVDHQVHQENAHNMVVCFRRGNWLGCHHCLTLLHRWQIGHMVHKTSCHLPQKFSSRISGERKLQRNWLTEIHR